MDNLVGQREQVAAPDSRLEAAFNDLPSFLDQTR
jgi:hypothetical protein